MSAAVLLIEETASIPEPVLREAGYAVHRASTAEEGYRAFRALHPQVVLLDLALPDRDGLDLMAACRRSDRSARFLIVAGNGASAGPVAAMHAGASEVLVRPLDAVRLAAAVAMALEAGDRDDPPVPGLIGSAPATCEVRRRIGAAARSSATVFLSGEGGTGKETCARAIHAASRRAPGPFVPVRCAWLADDLSDAEIAATLAPPVGTAGGTLFLDGIAEMAPRLQSRMVALLEAPDRGGPGGWTAAVGAMRIICATSGDPQDALRSGRLREDLFFRLHVVPIALPPLRARGTDAVEIAERLLPAFAAEEGKWFTHFAPEARRRILAHDWPGNVRELLNLLRCIAVLHDGPAVTPAMLPATLMSAPEGAAATVTAPAEVVAEVVADTPPEAPAQTPGDSDPASLERLIGRPLAEIEQIVIEETVRRQDGSVPRAARILAVSPSTIYRKREGWQRTP